MSDPTNLSDPRAKMRRAWVILAVVLAGLAMLAIFGKAKEFGLGVVVLGGARLIYYLLSRRR